MHRQVQYADRIRELVATAASEAEVPSPAAAGSIYISRGPEMKWSKIEVAKR